MNITIGAQHGDGKRHSHGGALVLKDGERDDLFTRGLMIKSVRAEAREVDFIASTDAIDSYDEIVEQTWRLDRFRANPVILYAHQSRELPIGKAMRTELVNGALEVTVRFATEEMNPKAEQVWKLLQAGMLRAVSVGFYPNEVRMEKRDGRDVYVLADNELMEVSVVPIPANPEALAKMKQRAISRATEKKTMTLEEALKLIGQLEATQKALEQSNTKLAEQLAEEKSSHAKALEKLEDVGARIELSTDDKAAVLMLSALVVDEKGAKVENPTFEQCAKAALKTIDGLQEKLVGKEVEDLVGKKITPAEKDAFLELAKNNRPLFERMVAQRPDLKLLGAPVVSHKQPDGTSAGNAPQLSAGGDVDLAADISKKADELVKEI